MLTAKQLFILCFIAGRSRLGFSAFGHDIRDAMRRVGLPISPYAFYQLMARMEEANLVEGRYDITNSDGQTIKRRQYTATKQGLVEMQRTLDFYRQCSHTAAGTGVTE